MHFSEIRVCSSLKMHLGPFPFFEVLLFFFAISEEGKKKRTLKICDISYIYGLKNGLFIHNVSVDSKRYKDQLVANANYTLIYGFFHTFPVD